MSDGDRRDPLEDAYVRAEQLVDDDAARAARRARVLAAIASPEPAQAGSSALPTRPAARWRPGWAAAAAVGGFGVLVATFALRSAPPGSSPPIVPADDATRPPAVPPVAAAPAPPKPPGAAEAPTMPRPAAPPAPSAGAPPAARPLARAAPPPPMDLPPPPPLPLPPTPKPVAQSEAPAVGALALDKAAPSPSAMSQRSVARPELTARDADAAGAVLRRAAAAGRTADVEAALDRGAPVDAPDENGDTALILSVRGGHVATTALLRRRGADPERSNVAGDSAAALATASGDVRLQEAVRAPRP